MSSEFLDRYNHKIVTAKKLSRIIGSFPRKKRSILCHGNFDVVHPGHLRHLSYAKSKADILIVSITADKYIKKGIYRPFVPERLRALNLAALEIVNYVLIDDNEKPLKNLKFLKPDFFAKGFEYTSKGLPAATQEESNVVTKYGGEIIFTPGDVVYSSTKLLNISEPHIKYEKLLLLMKNNNLSFTKLKNALKNIKNLHFHVIGDTIIDTHTKTTLVGGQTKTPTPSVLFQNKNNYIGGAGVVVRHLIEAGVKTSFSTVLGNDENKDLVLKNLKKQGVNLLAVIDKNRPTTNKNSFITDGYRILKVDTLDNQPISEKITNIISKNISSVKSDAVIFSDFRHGLFNTSSIPKFIRSIPAKSFKVADSQVATRWGNITDYKKFDLITPNEREARFSLADQDSSISDLTRRLIQKTVCKNLILKLGSRGIFSIKGKSNSKGAAFSISSFADRVVDPVGAGDALLAYSTIVMVLTKSLALSSIIGSLAAACQCEEEGNVSIKPEIILNKINEIEKKVKYKTF